MRLHRLFPVVLFAFNLAVGAQTLKISKDNRTVSVSASDHAEADPDVADVHVGFTAYGADLPSAYKSGSDLSSAVTAAIEKTGTPRSAIQSRTQRVERLDDAQSKVRKGMRFSVSQSWVVSVDPKNAALVLDAAVNAGANDSGDIEWRLKDSVGLDAEAVRRATVRAKALAESLASAAGSTLGQPIYLTNNVTGELVQFSRMSKVFATDGFTGGQLARPAAPLSIETQQVERTASVQVVYALQ
jgi:uncharacterized protein